MNELEERKNPKPIRPQGMGFFLVLSFIGSGFNAISNLFTYTAFPMLKETFANNDFSSLFPAEAIDASMAMLDINKIFYLIIALLNLVSFTGVLKMWKMDKIGFHIYAIAQVLILIANSVFLYPTQENSNLLSDLMLTGLFILLYYLMFKRIEFQNNGNQEGNI